MLLASEWVTHLTNEHAWDEMREVVENDPERAWRIIRAVIGSAPDYDVLATVAAGPIEDLLHDHGDAMMPMVAEEAKRSARLRICLRAAYSDFPDELRELIEAETADIRDLAPDHDSHLAGEDLALVISWLHHSDTAWASDFMKEMTATDPAAAWDVLRVLAVFADEDARIRDDVFDDAFHPFIRQNFDEYRDRLVALGRKSVAFRGWARERKSVTDDPEKWAAFVRELASV